MALTLNLTAHDPADIAALVNEALDHDRAEHSIELDGDGDITISIEIRAARRNLLPIQPGRGAPPPACDHAADLADPVHCYLLPGHDLPHRSHGLTWDDDGVLRSEPAPAADLHVDADAGEISERDLADIAEIEGVSIDEARRVLSSDPDPESEPVDDGPEEPAESGGASHPLTCGDAIIQLLESDRAVAWSIADIADGITGSYKQSTVSFTLGELARDGAIQRAGRGLYQAKQV